MPKALAKTKRGDTIIEVMFAFAIFCFVAIITVSSMGAGLNSIENSLELTTARNELNAQAEALRFIHSSYVSELTLPPCNGDLYQKCQQYEDLWGEIINGARDSSTSVAGNPISIEYPLLSCEEAYNFDNANKNSLYKNNAFVINTRQLVGTKSGLSFGYGLTADAIVRPSTNPAENLFYQAPLSARIIYSVARGTNAEDNNGQNSTGMNSLNKYTRIARVEGIWVIAVRSTLADGHNRPQYYDFYIQTCWNGPNSKTPTSLDTVIRLYNPHYEN